MNVSFRFISSYMVWWKLLLSFTLQVESKQAGRRLEWLEGMYVTK